MAGLGGTVARARVTTPPGPLVERAGVRGTPGTARPEVAAPSHPGSMQTISTRRASEGSLAIPSLARRVSVCHVACAGGGHSLIAPCHEPESPRALVAIRRPSKPLQTHTVFWYKSINQQPEPLNE